MLHFLLTLLPILPVAPHMSGSPSPPPPCLATPSHCFPSLVATDAARAGLSQLADTFVSDPQQHFQPGQSVRAQVVQIDVAHGKFGVTLKPSLTASKDSRLLASLFADYEAADALSAPEGEPVDWASAFAIGSAVDGQVHELKDYGVVCDLNGHEVGPLPPQCPRTALSPFAVARCACSLA